MTRCLDGQVAVITGGGRGIGEAIALEFASAGASLVLASRTPTELEEVEKKCRALGAHCTTSPTDVSEIEQVHRLVDKAHDYFGHIDVLVNAAATHGAIGPVTEIEPADWERAIRVILLGTLYACQAVLPGMIARGSGKIINFSGGGATSPLPRFTAYGASKAAVVRLTETLAEEVRVHGIDVNAIAPGFVDTRLQDAVLKAGERAGNEYRRVLALRETGEGATPIDQPAKLALFLASGESKGLTGRLISAPNDSWPVWDHARIAGLKGTPWYTLRRIDPYTVGPLRDLAP